MVGLIVAGITKLVTMGVKGQAKRFVSQAEFDAAHKHDGLSEKQLIDAYKKSQIDYKNYNIAKNAKTEKNAKIIIYGCLSIITVVVITGILKYKQKI